MHQSSPSLKPTCMLVPLWFHTLGFRLSVAAVSTAFIIIWLRNSESNPMMLLVYKGLDMGVMLGQRCSRRAPRLWCLCQSTDLHFLAPDVQGSYSEVHSYCVLLPLCKNPCLEILDHTGLPHVWVSDQDDLKQEIKSVIMLRSWGLHGGVRASQDVWKWRKWSFLVA